MNFERDTQPAIYRDGASGRRPVVPTSWPALERAAKRAMSPLALLIAVVFPDFGLWGLALFAPSGPIEGAIARRRKKVKA